MEKDKVTVKFGGNIDGVDINTFTRTVLAYAAVAQAACASIDASKRLDVQIGSTRPGCLEVTLNLNADAIKGLFDLAIASAPILPSIASTVTQYYELTKFLGNNGKISSTTIMNNGESAKITAENGSTITVNKPTYNIYTERPDVAKSLAGSFKELDNNPEIEYVDIDCGPDDKPSGKHFRATRQDFPAMATAPAYVDGNTKTIILRDQNLTVQRITLKRSTKSMWQFIWEGFAISANISDMVFFNDFDNYSFSIGDVMVVDLKVTKRYNKELQAYINERYEVVKVKDKHSSPKTEALF